MSGRRPSSLRALPVVVSVRQREDKRSVALHRGRDAAEVRLLLTSARPREAIMASSDGKKEVLSGKKKRRRRMPRALVVEYHPRMMVLRLIGAVSHVEPLNAPGQHDHGGERAR
jgi:hypothetical protein